MLFDGTRFLSRQYILATRRHTRTNTACRRGLLTLAIETSCDDTCVAILGKRPLNSAVEYRPAAGPLAKLFFNEKITANNTDYGGIHPLYSLRSHHASLAMLVNRSFQALPDAEGEHVQTLQVGNVSKIKPDFITVTRGPGMRSSLSCGLDTAKGLSVAWQVPLVAVHHMQAHALTPRLVSALHSGPDFYEQNPEFPFVTLLVSGGHTLLVHSRSLTEHSLLGSTRDIAVGDALDKLGRILLPEEVLQKVTDTAYAKHLSNYAFQTEEDFRDWYIPRSRAEEILRPNNQYGWRLTTPLADTRDLAFSFSGLATQVEQFFKASQQRGTSADERLMLARSAMGTSVEHLGSRTIIALQKLESEGSLPKTLVVSGGVASNNFLRYALREMLNVRGFANVQLVFPPANLCTDNAAMIAWTGMEMYEAGYRSDLGTIAQRRWSLEMLLQPETEFT